MNDRYVRVAWCADGFHQRVCSERAGALQEFEQFLQLGLAEARSDSVLGELYNGFRVQCVRVLQLGHLPGEPICVVRRQGEYEVAEAEFHVTAVRAEPYLTRPAGAENDRLPGAVQIYTGIHYSELYSRSERCANPQSTMIPDSAACTPIQPPHYTGDVSRFTHPPDYTGNVSRFTHPPYPG